MTAISVGLGRQRIAMELSKIPKLRRPMILLCLAGVAACSSLPEHADVSPKLPEQFLTPAGAESPARWWQALNDPLLDELLATAMLENPTVQQLAARLRAARAGATAAGAERFPVVNLSADHQNPLDDKFSAESNVLGLAASYELDLWGRIGATARAAQHHAAATEQEWQAARISLSANVATQWIRIGSARQRLALIAAERQAYENILQLVELRFRNGQVTASDVLRQRQLLESTRGLEAVTTADLGVLEHGLAELLGLAAGVDHWSGYQQTSLLPLPATGVPAQVVQRRPDVQQVWQQLLAADAEVAVAIANRFPRLSLGAASSTSAAGAADLFDNWISNLSASLLAPLIDGGRRRAEVERRKALLDQQLAAYRGVVLSAFREIQDGLLRDQQQQIRLGSLQSQLEFSDASVARLLKQLRNGSVDYPAVLDGQITNSALRRELHSARQTAQEFRISLYRVTAGPIPADIVVGQESM